MPVVLEGVAGPVELLTYGEAADLLDVRTPTIHTYVHRGVLHAIRLAASHPTPYKSDLPFVLAEEVAWYDARRRLGAPAAGPNPFAERYAELIAAGAPLLADPITQMIAQARAGALAAGAWPSSTQVPAAAPATPASISTVSTDAPALDVADAGVLGLVGWGGLAALLILLVLALILNRQPDAGKVAQLRAMPGAARLPRALREAADLLDKTAA